MEPESHVLFAVTVQWMKKIQPCILRTRDMLNGIANCFVPSIIETYECIRHVHMCLHMNPEILLGILLVLEKTLKCTYIIHPVN